MVPCRHVISIVLCQVCNVLKQQCGTGISFDRPVAKTLAALFEIF